MIKTKIVLDADVIIHFAKGGCLNILPNILKGYDYVVLDKVYQEIKEPLKSQFDNQMCLLKNICLLPFAPKGEVMKEYARLISNPSNLGKGESACMVYCRYNNDVVGSSNLKDISDYCAQYNITYLTTLDFLYYAIRNKLMTCQQANQFIDDVNRQDSKLPDIDMATYISSVEI